MNAPFDFEAWGNELSPENFEFGNMEMESETELGRRRRARGPARRGTVRPPPPARSPPTPRSPLLQLRPRFPFRPRPPARPVFPVILPAWGPWLAQPPLTQPPPAEPPAPPSGRQSGGGPAQVEPAYAEPAAPEPAAPEPQEPTAAEPTDTEPPSEPMDGAPPAQDEPPAEEFFQPETFAFEGAPDELEAWQAEASGNWVSTLVPLLNRHRGDIPLDFLLGWIAVESGGHIGVTTSLDERGYFQLHPGESKSLNVDHRRLSVDPEYSIKAGIAMVRMRARRASALGFSYGSDLFWHIVKLLHWLPGGVTVIVDDMKQQGFRPTTWQEFRDHVARRRQPLMQEIKRRFKGTWDPMRGIQNVEKLFARAKSLRASAPASTPIPAAPATPATPSVPAAPSSAGAASNWVSRLLPLLNRHRGDIPLDFLLGWIAVESGGRIGVTTSLDERGYFQLHPGESKSLNIDHRRLSVDPDYSVTAGIAMVRMRARRASALGFTYGTDLFWHIVKLLHWLPGGVTVIVDDMKQQGFRPTTWQEFRDYVVRRRQPLMQEIKRRFKGTWDPMRGIENVEKLFARARSLRASATASELGPVGGAAGAPSTAPSSRDLGARAVAIATQEWNRWNQGAIKESSPRMRSVLEDYWRTGVGFRPDGSQWWLRHPWSAAFMSWVMRRAGAGRAFRYAAAHAAYIKAAKDNRIANNDNPFKAYRVSEVAPQVGDLVCKSRAGSGATYDNIRRGMLTHCDIVTDVRPNRLMTIGGNVSNSVSMTPVATDAQGRIVSPNYFAVIKIGDRASRQTVSAPGIQPEVFEYEAEQTSFEAVPSSATSCGCSSCRQGAPCRCGSQTSFGSGVHRQRRSF
jgi:hypothetical protein